MVVPCLGALSKLFKCRILKKISIPLVFHFVIMHVEVSINISKVLFIVLHVFSKGKILFLKKKDDKAINKNRGK